MTAIPEFVDAVRRQQRAARHTTSLVLAVNTAGIAALTVVHTRFEWRHQLWTILLPAVVYLLLWLVVRLRRPFTGMGSSHDGFGLMAVIALAMVVAVPFAFAAFFLAGAGTFLGLGLVVVGARTGERALWVPGLVLMAVCPLVQLDVLENATFLGPQPGTLVLTVLTAVLLGLVSLAYLRERATLREPQVP